MNQTIKIVCKGHFQIEGQFKSQLRKLWTLIKKSCVSYDIIDKK